MSKSVLFIINGFGMGNATRCDSLMDILSDDYDIDVITSDKAYHYYKNNSKISYLYKQSDLNLQEKIKFGSLKYYMQYIPHFFKRLVRNYRLQKSIQTNKKYEAVFYDSDYGFILSAFSGAQKNRVGVNNSYEILSYLIKNPLRIKLNIIPSLLIEFLDFCTHYLFCNYIVCPCLDFDFNGQKTSAFKKVLLCAPLIRKALIEKNSSALPNTEQVLVMSSSSNVESGLSLLNQGPLSGYTFLTEKFETDNTDLLTSSSLIICNSGQSSLTECLYLNKKAIIEALPGHSEQYVNSLIAQNKGLHLFESDNAGLQIKGVTTSQKKTEYNYNYDLAVKNIKAQLQHIQKDIYEHMR